MARRAWRVKIDDRWRGKKGIRTAIGTINLGKTLEERLLGLICETCACGLRESSEDQ